MNLTIASIITTAAPIALRMMDKHNDYTLEPVFQIGDPVKGHVAYLKDITSENKIPIVWSVKDDELEDEDKADMVTAMLENAVWSMDQLLTT